MKQGWEMKKFEELIQENQIGLIKSTKEQGNDKAFRYLKMDSITSDNNLVHNKYVYVDATKDELEKFTLNDGDFLFNTRNSYELVGKTCVFSPYYDEPTLFNNNIMRVVFKKGISSKFINYAFSSEQVKGRLQKLKSGTTSVVGIYYNGLKNLQIPLPPLPEQQRIVSILDEAFAAIAKAKANAEQNLKNAKELFESYLQGVFENKGDGWEEKNLGEVASFSQGIQVGLEHHITEPQEGYARFIRIVDYTQDTDDIRYVPDPGRKYFVDENDIVMVRYGTPGLIGRGKAGVIANNLFKITIQREDLSNDFLCLCLSQNHIQTFLSTQGSATMPALNFGQLKNVIINFPPLKEQQTIVRQLDALRAETQKLEAVYRKKIADLEELKKSILQKAFSGELRTGKV